MRSQLPLLLGLFLISAQFAWSAVVEPSAVVDIPHMLMPIPSEYNYSTTNITINDPCHFAVNVNTNQRIPQIDTLIALYKTYMFPKSICLDQDIALISESADANSVLTVNIANASQFLMNYDVDESYTLVVQDGSFVLNATNYIGFVRGIETFSQLLSYTTNDQSATVITIPFTPVTIVDQPRFPHRGVMVDTARHFISKEKIFEVMDAMLSIKLNVFHWHLTDSDSFPIFIPSHPDLNQYGAFSPQETYSKQDVADIVNYAIVRGIKIIPETDSPSHVTSWSFDPAFHDLFVCADSIWYEGIPVGQIDPTQQASYDLVGDILSAIQAYFPWDAIHLGADEVYGRCWNTTSINSWMETNNVSDYNALFNYYIQRQRALIKPDRTRIYWTNPDTNYLQFEENDIVQFWGATTDLPDLLTTYPNNRFILSNYDYFYLDCGFGNYFGDNSWCDPFHTWVDLYNFEPTTYANPQQMANILGMEAAIWGELDNDSAIINKIFPRTCSMAEKGWSPLVNNYSSTYSLFVRLNAWIQRVKTRGIEAQPISAGYCEKHPAMCFA